MYTRFNLFSIKILVLIYGFFKHKSIYKRFKYSNSKLLLIQYSSAWYMIKIIAKLVICIVCSESKNQIYVKSFKFSTPIIIEHFSRMTNLLSENKIYQRLQIWLNKVSVIQNSRYFTVFIFKCPIKQNLSLTFISTRFYQSSSNSHIFKRCDSKKFFF